MPTTTIKFIDFNTFSNFGTPKDPNSLVFTGKFVELQAVNVEEKKPEWKKLSDRLQKGEHFLIMVDIDLLDDEYNPVTLSDNESKRAVQVTQLQNDLLNKIPKNIELKDVEKNIAWPYVSMQANLPLLTYLVDNRAILKIKSMSELHKMP